LRHVVAWHVVRAVNRKDMKEMPYLSNVLNVAGLATLLSRCRVVSNRVAAGRKRAALLAICGTGLACVSGSGVAVAAPSSPAASSSAASSPSLRVIGNRLVNSATGARFVPHGVNWPSFEYACYWGYGYSNPATASSVGPDAADAAAIASWGINTVRVPLNEGCWLGRDGLPAKRLTAGGYRRAVVDWVNVLNARGLAVILDLHWSGPPGTAADQQRGMADSQSPTFWSSVASAFKGYSGVMFDAFNEPYSIDAQVKDGYPPPGVKLDMTWPCWRDGGCRMPTQSDAVLKADPPVPFNGRAYTVFGMQSLVNAIRNAGAKQPILLGGLDYSNDLRQWLAFRPTNPRTGLIDDQLVASVHTYEGQRCSDPRCWKADLSPVAARVPVVVGEFAQDGTTKPDGSLDTFDEDLMHWADKNVDQGGNPAPVGYLMWAWVVPDRGSSDPHIVIADRRYTPQAPNGTALKAHLAGMSS
jgi:endoglucanase